MNEHKLVITNYKNGILTFVTDQTSLHSIQFSLSNNQAKIGDIFVAKVMNVVKNIESAFIQYEKDKIGFLPVAKLENPILLNRIFDGRILAGDEILVQLEKEAIRSKEPVFTTNLSLAGKYCVVSSGNLTKGVSSKIDKKNKDTLYQMIPQTISYGIVIRTNAVELIANEEYDYLKNEIISLSNKMDEIISFGTHRTCYTKVYQAIPEYIKAIQDEHKDSFDSIVTDDPVIYNDVIDFYKKFDSSFTNKISLYKDSDYSLHKLYRVDTQVQELLDKKVWLKSGAYLVIEQTEAMYVIDVNSGKNIIKKDQDTVAFQINMEAATEIMRQIKLRNLSAIIMVDFINMKQKELETQLLQILAKLAKADHVKTTIVDITSLGLVEITRKKTKKSLKQQMTVDI